jgi:putative FmdB family regulatory protein
MPVYEYRRKDGETGCPHCAQGFETVQSMKDDALNACPKCGCAIERVISSPSIVKSNKSLLSDKNLKAHGFEKLVKEDKGRYRRTTT